MTNEFNAALEAIRAIPNFSNTEIQQIVATLSCQIAVDINSHSRLHQEAIDSLDDLANYLADEIADMDES